MKSATGYALAIVIVGCSQGNQDKPQYEVIGEGVQKDYLQLVVKTDSPEIFAYCQARDDGKGVNVFIRDRIKDNLGAKCEVVRDKENFRINLPWKLFEGTKVQVWIEGTDDLGPWQISFLESKENQ